MLKNRVLQLQFARRTDPTTEISDTKTEMNDIAATTVLSVKEIMRNGAKLLAAWVVLDTARQIVVNKVTK